METLKGIGSIAIAVGVILAIGFALALIFSGVVYVSTNVLPWLSIAAWFALGICLVILLPLSFFRATRVVSSVGFVIGSYIFGLCGWVYGFLVAYTLWGFIGVAVGLVFLGIGVMPVAILASIISGSGQVALELLALLVLTFASRMYGFYLASKADEDAYERNTLMLEAK